MFQGRFFSPHGVLELSGWKPSSGYLTQFVGEIVGVDGGCYATAMVAEASVARRVVAFDGEEAGGGIGPLRMGGEGGGRGGEKKAAKSEDDDVC
jgi:hypothetical protein